MGVRRVRWASVIVMALAVAVLFGLRASEGFAVALTNAVSMPMGMLLSRLSARGPFPLGEALTLFGAVLAAALLIPSILRRWFARYCSILALVVAVLTLSYALLWQPLHHVPTLAQRLNLPSDGAYSAQELAALCDELIADANRLGPELKTADLADIPALAQQALECVTEIPIRVDPPKIARYPELFRALNLAGVFFPWTGEAVFSGAEPAVTIPFLAAHESAHSAGFAGEDEANYIAYLACLQGDEYFQYSGTMYALYYAMEALHDADTQLWNARYAAMSREVATDYYRMNGLRNAEKPRFAAFEQGATEAFLRISRQQSPRSYGDMIDLLLAARRANR